MNLLSSNTPSYTSNYRYGVDANRRIQVPAKWRPNDDETRFTLVLWPTRTRQEDSLTVLPPHEWVTLVKKPDEMPFSNPKAQALRRLIWKESHKMSLDKVGRICSPESMAKAAAIEEEAVLVGSDDRFEIWSPDLY